MENKTEQWKQIDTFERYLISNKGRVISTVKDIIPLKIQTDKLGYKFVRIYPEDARFGYYPNGRGVKPKLEKIHRLVLDAFNPTKNPELECNHINGNKADNRLENLEWTTRRQNILHSWRIGLRDNASEKGALKRQKSLVAIHTDGHRRYFESRLHMMFGTYCSRGIISKSIKTGEVIERGPAAGYRLEDINELPEGEVWEIIRAFDDRRNKYNDKYYSKYLKGRKRKK
jgi:hypothetical protein